MASSKKDTSKRDIDWRVVALAETHPTRILILEEFRKDSVPLSPWKLAARIGEKHNCVAYHVRALAEGELLILDHTKQRRGATEHFYRLSDEVIA